MSNNFLKETGTNRILKIIKELSNKFSSVLYNTSVLSTVSECTDSTNDTDVAGAKALTELATKVDGLKTLDGSNATITDEEIQEILESV